MLKQALVQGTESTGGKRNIWIVDGKAYDLTPFLLDHPGGAIFLNYSRGRDVTAHVYTYHARPARVLERLQEFAVTHTAAKDLVLPRRLTPSLIPPPFLWPELKEPADFADMLQARSR